MAIQEQEKTLVYFKKQAQVGALLFNKISTEISVKYSNYSNIFSTENTAELSKNTGIDNHAIKLEKNKQPLFGPIYSLRLVELETLKTYIKINLANSFIWSSKSPAKALILFDKKLDKNLYLCVNY